MFQALLDEVSNYCSLRFTQDELDYLKSIYFIQSDFIDFLKLYQPNREHINLYLDGNQLRIEVEGPWYLTIFFEVPILAIVNEVYFKFTKPLPRYESAAFRLLSKLSIAEKEGFKFSDFGTRRRFSRVWHNTVLETICDNKNLNFAGTSNLYFAKKFNLTPIGTMAHEYIMGGAGQDSVPLVKSQSFMLQKWVDEYRGDLGIALTDTYGMDAFLRDFDKYFAKLYDGLRHDSGCPYEWGWKAINHYKKLGIDPKTKTLVFSDGLDMNKASKIHKEFKNETNVSFGIGTNLTNDFKNAEPLQIVMKIVECNGRPVAKVSDTQGKGMCHDEEYLSYVKKVFKIS